MAARVRILTMLLSHFAISVSFSRYCRHQLPHAAIFSLVSLSSRAARHEPLELCDNMFLQPIVVILGMTPRSKLSAAGRSALYGFTKCIFRQWRIKWAVASRQITDIAKYQSVIERWWCTAWRNWYCPQADWWLPPREKEILLWLLPLATEHLNLIHIRLTIYVTPVDFPPSSAYHILHKRKPMLAKAAQAMQHHIQASQSLMARYAICTPASIDYY